MRVDPREAPVRRAGSAKIASTPSPASSSTSTSMTSPRRTCAPSKSRRFAATAPAASGSMSTASTSRPRPAIASASPPIPHPRSATRVAPLVRKRRAWRAATTRRVACSRPSRVNTMWVATGPNFLRAAWRNANWVTTAAASSASTPDARSAAPSSRSGIGWDSRRACRDSSSSQPGEDRIGVRVLTDPLSHLLGDEVVVAARSRVALAGMEGRDGRIAHGERPWHSGCPSARPATTLGEEARDLPATGPAPDPRDGRERTSTFVTQKKGSDNVDLH